tara:strand:+ start:322 stop:996 length:675 start_codon:yes stop_codon:yes gene_type:complete
MGFLDHSTNNIIVDAVLTDLGRQALSRNDGSFSIYQFALGDDEVDYDIIRHFGRTVGKEKIEKNTPILEALTQANLGLKYPLVSVSNEFLTHMPVLTITSTSPLALNRNNTTTGLLQFDIEPKGDSQTIEFELQDSEFLVEVNNIFLKIQGEAPDIIYTDNIATYRHPQSAVSGNKINVNINLALKNFSQTTFNSFSVNGTITTFVKITGVNSGLTKTATVTIT